MDLRVPVGMDALSLWFLDLPQRLWLVLAAGKYLGGMEHRSPNRERSPNLQRTQTARHARADFIGQPLCTGEPGTCGPEQGGNTERFRRPRSGPRQCAQSGENLAADGANQFNRRGRHACPAGCIRDAHAARRHSRILFASNQYSDAQWYSVAQLGPDVQSPHERWRRGRVSSQPARQSPLAKRGSSRVCRT